MPKRLIIALVLGCACAAAGSSLHAGEPTEIKPKEEELDPDVLRKVRKLIKGTLSLDEAEREKAWNQIKEMGNLAIPGLIGLYRQKTTTPEEIGSILIAIGDSQDPRAWAALAELLGSSAKLVRRDAARAMGDSGYKAGIPALRKVAQDANEDEEVRLFAAAAGAKLGDDGAFGVLAELLKSQHPEIRSRAVFAIGKCGGIKQVAQIEAALSDSDASVREDAVEALRLLKKEAAWPALIKATGDDEYKIRNAAMDALRELTGEKFENDPKAWQEWWKTRPADGKKAESRKQ